MHTQKTGLVCKGLNSCMLLNMHDTCNMHIVHMTQHILHIWHNTYCTYDTQHTLHMTQHILYIWHSQHILHMTHATHTAQMTHATHTAQMTHTAHMTLTTHTAQMTLTTHIAHIRYCQERIFRKHTQKSHTHRSPFYLCSLSVRHTVNWASESCITHSTHSRTRAPVTHLIALYTALLLLLSGHEATGAAAAWSICTRFGGRILHQQEDSFSLTVFHFCLISCSPQGTDGDQQKTLLYENPNGVCERVCRHLKLCVLCVCVCLCQQGGGRVRHRCLEVVVLLAIDLLYV